MSKVLVDRELLPCPFCGGEARLDQRTTQSLWNSSDAVFSHVACDECDISGQDFCDDPNGEEASEWWNRRAQPAEAEAVDVRKIVVDSLVSIIAGVTRMIPPTDQPLPDFIQAPVDRAVERISAALPAVTAERDKIKADRKACWEEFKALVKSSCEKESYLQGEIDQLRTEVEALRAMAQRANTLLRQIADSGYDDDSIDALTCWLEEHPGAKLFDRVSAMAAKEGE